MDAIRKEAAGRSYLFYGMTMIGIMLMKLLSALPYPHSMQLVVLEFLVLFLGCIIPPIYFFHFCCSFVEDVIEIRLWSSIWTWLMRYPRFQQAFVTGEYVGFRRLCVFIIGTCIMLYVIPDFHQEGLMMLPALTMGSAVVFIIQGFHIQKEG